MSFCPRCGAPTTTSMTFCTSCGETLQQPGAGAPGGLAPGSPSGSPLAPGTTMAPPPTGAMGQPTAPRGPVGKTVEPWLVPVLTLVTLGIYQFFFWLRVSREVDDHRQTPGHARKPTLIGLSLTAVGLVLYLIGFVSFFASMDFSDTSTELTDDELGGIMGGMGMFMLGALTLLAGVIFWYVGQWRVWSGIEAEERARNHPKPLSPGLQLVFVLVPYLNIVTFWIAIYRTQDRLNGLWGATRPAP